MIRKRILIVAATVLALLLVLVLAKRKGERPQAWKPAPAEITRAKTNKPQPVFYAPAHSNNPLGVKRAWEFNETEKAALAQNFAQRIKPAVSKWINAYGNRAPFKPDDLTLDKFAERLGQNPSFYLYTFVMGDVTLSVEEVNDTTKVMYMMSKRAAVAMNNLPASGTVPDVTTPVTRDEIIAMVQADTGVMFKPNEVIIHPSAESGALNGGEYVSLLPTGANPNNGLASKIDFVFGHGGTMLNYDRDPFF